MGVSWSWVCVQGLDKASVLEALGLAEGEEVDTQGGGGFTCAEFPNRWTVVVSTEDPEWATPDLLRKLSASGRAAGCQVMDTIMYTAAWGFRDGVQEWKLEHYLDEDKILETTGEPPPPFERLRDEATRLEAEDDSVDYSYEVPTQLIEAITGFRHDASYEGERVFRLARPIKPVKQASSAPRGWLSRLLGGRS